jgi:RHS repeat-associated protein
MRKESVERFLALVIMWTLIGTIRAQQAGPDFDDPVRGFEPTAAYSLDGIESINQSNGNIVLTLPLATLYAGPVQFPLSAFSLYYNSKLYTTAYYTLYKWSGGSYKAYNYYQVSLSPQGGWNYTTGYQFELLTRPIYDSGSGTPTTQWCTAHIDQYRMFIDLPDGSRHEMRASGYAGYESADGYSQIMPNPSDQNIPSGCTGSVVSLPASLTYYSIDGTYLRLVVQTGSAWQYNWTLYFPDGARVATTSSNGTQTITDRNNNKLTITKALASGPVTTFSDQFGRNITVTWRTSTPGSDQITATGAGGTSLTSSVHWHTITPPTFQYSCGDPADTGCTGNLNLGLTGVDQIQLPIQAGAIDGGSTPLSYALTYNTENGNEGFGEVASVTLPTTATVAYAYLNDGRSPTAEALAENTIKVKAVTWDSEYDGSSTPQTDTWSYSFTQTGASGSSTITAPDGGITTNSFYPFPALGSGAWIVFEGLIYETQYPDGSTEQTAWQQNIPPIATPHVGDTMNAYRAFSIASAVNSASTLTLTKADQYSYDQNGNLTSDQQYAWQAYGSPPITLTSGIATGFTGTVVRTKTSTPCVTTFVAGSASVSANGYYSTSAPLIRNPVCAVETDYAGVPSSRTEYSYNAQFDLTGETHWDSTKGAYSTPLTSGNSITTSHTYGPNGTLTSTTDAIGTVTQFTYGSVNGQTNLCPTQQVAASNASSLERTTDFTLDFWTCLPISTTDVENGNVTATSYDPFGRMTSRIEAQGRPEQRTTTVKYQDGCDSPNTSCRYAFVTSDLNSGDGALTWVYRYDELGRLRLTQQMEASQSTVPAETVGIKVQTRRVFTGGQYTLVSNPFRASVSTGATGESTMGWTLTAFDTMGRVSAQRNFGGATAPAWTQTTGGSGATTTVYSASTAANTFGTLTTVTDPAGKQRTMVYDGLGRMTNVIEAPSGLNYATTYAYDGLDDLISVTQSSISRHFAYDSLGRLSSAMNPESGTTCYGTVNAGTGACQPAGGYDGNGNLLEKGFKIAFQSGTYTATVETLAYDKLNRLIQKTYTGGTPTASMCYDGNTTATSSAGSVNVTCTGAPALSGVNARGRLTWATNGTSTNSYSKFDSYGRILQHSQITNGTTYPFSYSYNEVGLTEEVYPSTRSVTLAYDGAGRVSLISGTKSYTSSAIQYTAHGAVTALPLAVDGLTEQRCYSSRLQPFAIRLGSGATTNCANSSDALNLQFSYGATQDSTGNVTSGDDNGNVLSQQIARAGQTTVTQSYPSYDGVNRLGSATESGGTGEWSQTYGYDAYGNRWVGGTTLSSFTPSAQTNFNSSNQLLIQSSSYDAAGNQQAIGAYSFQYDGENRQTSATVGGTTVGTYGYDAEGRRVTKGSGGATTVYVYDAMGQLTAEYYSGTAPTALCPTCYLTVDQLGSTRQETNGTSGQVAACHDYLPFGEEIPSGTGGRTAACFTAVDITTQRFTSKQRDTETASSAMQGLDFFGARYFSGAQGRFTTVDPEGASASLFDPQRWNGYSYALNNPYKFVDPDGEVPLLLISAGVGAGAGAVGGAVFDVANQLIQNGGHFDQINGREVGAAALGGLVSGGIAGLTLGLIPAPATLTAGYLATSAAVNGGANAVGGLVQREVDPSTSGSPAADFVTGALGGAIGTKVAYVRYPLPNVKRELQAIAFSNRRSLRPQKIADLNSRAFTQSVKNIVTLSVAGTAITNFFSDLWFDLVSRVSTPKREVVTSKLCSPDNPCTGSSSQPVTQQ